MTKTFKLISAAALVAATSTAAFAQDVPLNTTVSGGQGAEIKAGQGEAGGVVIPAMTFVVVTAAALALGASDDSSTTTTTTP